MTDAHPSSRHTYLGFLFTKDRGPRATGREFHSQGRTEAKAGPKVGCVVAPVPSHSQAHASLLVRSRATPPVFYTTPPRLNTVKVPVWLSGRWDLGVPALGFGVLATWRLANVLREVEL